MTVIKRTETALGGFFADPPTMTGRAPDGGRLWSYVAAEQMVVHALARQTDPTALRPPSRWDLEGELPFPAIRRLAVKSPAILRTLPTQLGARPGTRYLEGIVDRRRRRKSPSPVALDPGDNLAGWQDLAWLDRSNGQPIRATTESTDTGAVLLDTLDHRVMEWTAPPTSMAIAEVHVDPLFVQVVGRVSGVIDADLDGASDPEDERPVYDRGQRLAGIQNLAAAWGPSEFRRRTGLALSVAHRAAAGRRISDRNIEKALRNLRISAVSRRCALDGCDEAVTRPNADYCCIAHKDRAYRKRKRHRSTEPTPASEPVDPTAVYCRYCDTELMGRATARGTCSRHKEAP